MSIYIGELIRTTGKSKLEDKKSMPFKDVTKWHPTLKELREKKYPLLDLDLLGMLDDLKKQIIELLELKRSK